MPAKVISLTKRIDELERAAWERERTAEMWELFGEAAEIIEILPRWMLVKLMTRCRMRLNKV